MADSKSKVQETIEKLGRLKGYLDAQITIYKDAQDKIDDDYEVAENEARRDKAKSELANQVSRIDQLIMSDPEIKEQIGSIETGDVEKLNEVITEVLKRVEKMKTLGIKDLKGKDGKTDVSLDTKTGTAVSEVEKLKTLDPYLADVDYDNITIAELDSRIAALETKVASDEEVKKYEDAKKQIASEKTPPVDPKDIDISDEYDAFISTFEKKLNEYEKYQQAESFNVKHFKNIRSRDSLKSNKPRVQTLLSLQKTINGDVEIKVDGTTKKIKELKYEDLEKLSNNGIKSVLDDLSRLTLEAKSKTGEKSKELKEVLSSNSVMKLFDEDKAKMEAVLTASPIKVAELRTIISNLRKMDSKNFETINRLEKIDPQEAASVKKEIARLTTLRDKMKTLEETEGKTFEAEDITKININGVEVELKKDAKKGKAIDGRIVDLDMESEDMSLVVSRTYRDLFKKKPEKFTELEMQVIEESKTGERLPREFGIFSRIAARLRGETQTRREQAIESRVIKKIKDQIKSEQDTSRGVASGKKIQAVETAKDERKNAFELDEDTRVKVNRNAYEAARKAIINDGKKAEEAYKEAGREEEK